MRNGIGSTEPYEKRYPAQITRNATAAASANVGRRFRISAPQASFGRPETRYHTPRVTTALAGKKSRLENFERIARAPEPPNHTACFHAGSSSQTAPHTKASPRNAVSAISVVARPACARIVGSKLNANTAIAAIAASKYRIPHQYTARQPIQKNGRIPRRATDKVRS